MINGQIFDFIYGYTLDAHDLPDGCFFALHDEAVKSYNNEFGTDYDWYDIQYEYSKWCEACEQG